jgi:hypothetical protein
MAKFKGVVKRCEECGKEFRLPQSLAERKYCSRVCGYKHTNDWHRTGKVELECPECKKHFFEFPSRAKGRVFCSRICKHKSEQYRQLKRTLSTGENNGMWGGGGTDHADGYRYAYAPHHPYEHTGYVLEHRLVMEEWLREHEPDSEFLVQVGDKLYLNPKCVVHHNDGVRQHNSIGNLTAMWIGDHISFHNNEREVQTN